MKYDYISNQKKKIRIRKHVGPMLFNCHPRIGYLNVIREYSIIIRGYLNITREYSIIIRGYVNAIRGYLNVIRNYLIVMFSRSAPWRAWLRSAPDAPAHDGEGGHDAGEAPPLRRLHQVGRFFSSFFIFRFYGQIFAQ